MNKPELTFTLITDVHSYSKSIGVEGAAYDRANAKSQLLLKDSVDVLAAVFNRISKDKTNDIVLLSGDVTSNAEFSSHSEIIALLRALKATGKRVYVITATHDYADDGVTYEYKGDEKVPVEAVTRSQLFDMYREFGPDEAIAVERESMSYVVQLDEGFRLFALNDDKNGSGKSGFSPETFDWIMHQVEDAQANNQTIITMTHHPMIAPSEFYALIGKNDMMGGHDERLKQFADAGINFVFTGHSHIHDVSYRFTEKGNVFYDISTASPVGYPGYYRRVTVNREDELIKIETLTPEGMSVPSFGEETVEERLKNQFFGMIGSVIDAAATDIDSLAEKVTAFSVKKELIYKIGWLIKPFAKLIKKLSVGRVASWCKRESGLKKSDYKSLMNESAVDFIITLPMNLYKGDGEYTPDTLYYKITMGFMSVIDSVFDAFHIKVSKIFKGADSLCSVIEPLLYNNSIPDSDVTLPMHPTKDELESEFLKKNDTVYKSRKGKPIAAVLILLIILLIPLLPLGLVVLAVGYVVNYLKYHKKIKGEK